MTRYISLLRGINVSGQKLLKMDALRILYEKLGFQNIVTYMQSGNVAFSGKESKLDELQRTISMQIEKDFGFYVPVIVLSVEQLTQIIKNNPFLKDNSKDNAFLHITFLAEKTSTFDMQAIEEKKQKGEEIIIGDKIIYLYCPNGYGKSKLNNGFIESKLKVIATTRNWKTTNELMKIAQTKQD